MQLIRVEAEQFRGVERAVLELENELGLVEPLVLVTGPPESGKTSLLDAVALCLRPGLRLPPTHLAPSSRPVPVARCGADQARVVSHLAACEQCRRAEQQLRRVMTLVDHASPVDAPPGFERTAWARLEPALDANRPTWKSIFWFPQWALAGGVAALVLAAFVAGRFSGGEPAGVTPDPAVRATASPVIADLAERVLTAEVGDHLDRSQMMLVELANANTDEADVFALEQQRGESLASVREEPFDSGQLSIPADDRCARRCCLQLHCAP